jgi:phage N-6-adenine-methyltransferase
MNSGLMFSKASDEWSTPQVFFDALDREFRFGLDAAASDDNAKCTAFFTRDDDALTRNWYPGQGWAVWLNPPYSQCREFIAKAAEESMLNGVTVVALVPSRTDTKWWHGSVWNERLNRPYDGVEVRFIKGRLKFGDGKNSAPFPSVVVVFRPVSGLTS